MPVSRHRRPSTLWTATGLAAVVAAGAALVSALADTSGEVREWTQPSPSAVPSADPTDALRVSVQSSGSGDATCMRPEYVVRGGLTDLQGDPAPPETRFGPDESALWFEAHGAMPTADTVVFVVENLRHGRAVLRDLRAVIDSWEPAPDAARVVPTGGGCGAHLDIQDFDLALRDVRQPINAVARRPTKGFPYTVADDDPLQFQVFVAAPTGIATWHLELRWTLGGKAHTTRLPAGTETFRSGTGPSYCAPTVAELARSPRRCR